MWAPACPARRSTAAGRSSARRRTAAARAPQSGRPARRCGPAAGRSSVPGPLPAPPAAHRTARTRTDRSHPPVITWTPTRAAKRGPEQSRREGVVTRAHEYRALNRWIARHPHRIESEELSEAVCAHVKAALDRARDRNPWRALTGSSLQGAATNLDAAEACILRLAPDSFLQGQMPCFIAHV